MSKPVLMGIIRLKGKNTEEKQSSPKIVFLGIREIPVLLSQDACGALVQCVCSSCMDIV